MSHVTDAEETLAPTVTVRDRESPVGYGDVPSRYELNVDGPAILAGGKDFQGDVIACVPRVEAYLGERRRKLGAG